MSIRHVIWDFNGTLLDDVDCCVDSLNTLLAERALPGLLRADYLARFGFPVRDFYLNLGFDFEREDFDRVSATFIAGYRARLHHAAAHAGAHDALLAVQRAGVPQSVVSAMELTLLRTLLERFELHAYMTHVRGLDHLNANSKIALGVSLQRELALEPQEILLVGDTLHDHELAQAIGCHCLLFVGGHQTSARLHASGAPLIDSLAEVARFVTARS
jgi:phosphoglycolate phosphatase